MNAIKPNNPFLIAGYYSPEYFCDRQKETETIISALENGRNLSLIAPRRIGKTGLIKHVFYTLKQKNPDISTFYLDIYSTHCLGDFVKLFTSTILGNLDTEPEKILAGISKFIRSCRPAVTFDELSGVPKISLDISPEQEEPTLKEIFDYLASSEKRCYIAIDEFQQISQYPEKGIEALLRSYIQFLPNVNFIFAGSRQSLMQEMFVSSKRPFYQSTQIMSIGSIDCEEYTLFAQRFFSQRGTKLPADIFKNLYDKFDGQTWYIQYLLNRLYSYGRDVDAELIEYATAEIISEMEYLYAELLKTCSPGQAKLLKAVAAENCVAEPLSGDFISRYKLKAASSVSSALNKLIENELIYKSPEGYIVYDRFFGRWLRTLQ